MRKYQSPSLVVMTEAILDLALCGEKINMERVNARLLELLDTTSLPPAIVDLTYQAWRNMPCATERDNALLERAFRLILKHRWGNDWAEVVQDRTGNRLAESHARG